MSVLRSHNNKTCGGLGRVCATGMYRSIEHVKFPEFLVNGKRPPNRDSSRATLEPSPPFRASKIIITQIIDFASALNLEA